MHREDHVLAQLGVDTLADLWMLDHGHADRMSGHVSEVIAAVGEALRDRTMCVVRGRAGTKGRLRPVEVLLVRLEHPPHLGIWLPERTRDLDPVTTGARDFERRDAEVAEHGVPARNREL